MSEAFVLTPPDPPPERRVPKGPPRITSAQERVLGKAVRRGLVRRAGGYGPHAPGGAAHTASAGERRRAAREFDRGDVVDRLVARGLLAPGEQANTYVPTARARSVLRALQLSRKLRQAQAPA